MATLKIPRLYSFYTDNQMLIQLEGNTIDELFKQLYLTHPAIEKHLLDAKGNFRRHINIFVHGENIRTLEGNQTPLAPDDVITILPNISGG